MPGKLLFSRGEGTMVSVTGPEKATKLEDFQLTAGA